MVDQKDSAFVTVPLTNQITSQVSDFRFRQFSPISTTDKFASGLFGNFRYKSKSARSKAQQVGLEKKEKRGKGGYQQFFALRKGYQDEVSCERLWRLLSRDLCIYSVSTNRVPLIYDRYFQHSVSYASLLFNQQLSVWLDHVFVFGLLE